MSSLVWFRSDLRLADNPALSTACLRGEPVRALYIHSPEQRRRHGNGPRQLELIERRLNALGDELAALGIPLELLEVKDFSRLAQALERWCQEHGISRIFANAETGLNEGRRDRAVAALLPLEPVGSDCLIPPGTLHTGSGAPYRVFTPFARAWLKRLSELGYRCLPSPAAQGAPIAFSPIQLSGAKDDSSAWPVDSAAIQDRLSRFCRGALSDYDARRDYPAQAATSALSPYLALGMLSVGQCLQAIETAQGFLPLSRGETGFAWLNELIWREFYRHLLGAYTELCKHRPFKAETDRLPWRQNPEQLRRWQEGSTGFPLIDAAMRCLKHTGWMHNRLRMLVASFLTKDLLIDWRLGEAWFMQQLLDADLASNNGGWQWAAGTGADAAPYFRIFNPTTQSRRFDAAGTFIRQWLPELADLPDSAIHAPATWLADRGQSHRYPLPIVDHAKARSRVITLFQGLRPEEAP